MSTNKATKVSTGHELDRAVTFDDAVEAIRSAVGKLTAEGLVDAADWEWETHGDPCVLVSPPKFRQNLLIVPYKLYGRGAPDHIWFKFLIKFEDFAIMHEVRAYTVRTLKRELRSLFRRLWK